MPVFEKTALMVLLKKLNSVYYGKVLELRTAIEEWLSYIPHTFPHYTRHTARHSEEIVQQLSNLLFEDGGKLKSSVQLSATELYVLIASAFFHDAGMVVSDKEKTTILAQEDWQAWVSETGPGGKRWRDIQELRKREDHLGQNAFIADLQVRYLIAEFLRRVHHIRSGSVISENEDRLAQFAFGDPMLLRTIADVCIAHGLRQHELDDSERFPERRDVRNDKVNVRFLAILLRIGDLLDISIDRACPLLLNAACPLPPDSLAHWSQYQRITHRLTAPDRIEIVAECESQEEHRYILDWCQWLVDELREARYRMSRATRHNGWLAPKAELNNEIVVRPKKGATYIPSKWAFELDADSIYKILTKYSYSDPLTFIRELIQNSLDATRCTMYYDLAASSLEIPEYPTQIPEDFRYRYPLEIKLEEKLIENKLSGELEKRHVFVIDDCGIGMDSEVIEKYFLQVGRSFYTSDEFRRKYLFTPTSRFGIGFLSVFSASDYVTVETYKPTSLTSTGAISLTLTGPRNYLLTDRSLRRKAGTRIEAMLRENLQPGRLTEVVSKWCRMVEVPVKINDLGVETVLEAEKTGDFDFEITDVTEPKVKLRLKSFPVNRLGIEGSLYVIARVIDSQESWTQMYWVKEVYPSKHPAATLPDIPQSITCLHGIVVEENVYYSGSMIARIDCRRGGDPTVSRETLTSSDMKLMLNDRWKELLVGHLNSTDFARGAASWHYKQRLAANYPIEGFWNGVDGVVPVFCAEGDKFLSIDEVATHTVTTTFHYDLVSKGYSYYLYSDAKIPTYRPDCCGDGLFIDGFDLLKMQENIKNEIFRQRRPCNLRWRNDDLLIDWVPRSNDVFFWKKSIHCIITCNFSSTDMIGCNIHAIKDYTLLLNSEHPFVNWLLTAEKCCRNGGAKITKIQVDRIFEFIWNCFDTYKKKDEFEKLCNYISALNDTGVECIIKNLSHKQFSNSMITIGSQSHSHEEDDIQAILGNLSSIKSTRSVKRIKISK